MPNFSMHDRIADIPIHHRLRDYVCTVGYSERDGEFHYVSVRAINGATHIDGSHLYLRVLREPALRASLLEALVPEKKSQIAELREKALVERSKNNGFALGFIALCALGYVLYRLTFPLAKYVGFGTAEAITYLPMFFAFLIIFPVQHFVERWYLRRYCIQHGHRLQYYKDTQGIQVAWCKRCGLHLGRVTAGVSDTSSKD